MSLIFSRVQNKILCENIVIHMILVKYPETTVLYRNAQKQTVYHSNQKDLCEKRSLTKKNF